MGLIVVNGTARTRRKREERSPLWLLDAGSRASVLTSFLTTVLISVAARASEGADEVRGGLLTSLLAFAQFSSLSLH